MKRKIKKIISFIIYFIGIIALFDYSFKLHNNYVFKQNTLTQTSSYNDNQINFNRFNVTEKDIIKKNFITHEKTHAVLISTTSLSSAYDREVSKNGSLSARIYEVCAERDGLKGQVRDYERVRRAIGPEQADRILEAAYQQEQVEKEQKWGARSKIRVGAR